MKRVLSFLVLLVATALSAQALKEVELVQSVVPDGGSDHKIAYGIYVKVAGGDTPRLFQFDTGNGSFLAGYSGTAPAANQYWGTSFTTLSVEDFHTGFGSGITMDFKKVSAQVTLSNSLGQNIETISSMNMGQVYAAHGDDLPSANYWQDTIAADQPALHQTYFGNFGAGVYRGTGADSAIAMYSALGQIENLVGYTVSLSGPNPKLVLVFDTPEDHAYVDSFTHATSMYGAEGQFPVTGWDAHSEFPTIAATYEVNGVTVSGTSGLFDTGGTSFGLNDAAREALDQAGLTDGSEVIPGQNFGISFVGAGEVDGQTFEDFTLNFTTGTSKGGDLVTTSTNTSQLNYGPAIYNYYDVYYDLQNSVVRFRAVPEPGVIGLAGVGGLLLSGVWKFLRRRRV